MAFQERANIDNESNSSRKVYTLGPHQRLLDNYDINASGNLNRYDQVFDSQISRQSHDTSVELSNRNQINLGAYDSNLSSTHQAALKKSETEILKSQHSQLLHFSTHKKGHQGLANMRSGHLQVIDENKSSIGGLSNYNGKRGISGARSTMSVHGMPNGSTINQQVTTLRNNDLSDVISQSNRLEESVKAPDRMPRRIPELTNYLCDQHYKKYGVFSRKKTDLFKFWKNHVSVHYRITNKKDKNDMSMMSGISPKRIHMKFDGSMPHHESNHNLTNNSILIQNQAALGQSFKSQAHKENYTDNNMKDIVEKTIYNQFERLYEMDVIYTLQQDLDEEEENFKLQQLKRENEMRDEREKNIRQYEQQQIKYMLDLYYTDLLEYKIKLLTSHDEENRKQQEVSPNKNWTRQVTGGGVRDSLNPIESMDDTDRKEPKKPTISEQELNKEKEKIEREIRSELDFMEKLFYMSREFGLTNDPRTLMTQYKTTTEKARLGLITSRDDREVERLINEFFKPERFLKRLNLYFVRRNKNGQFKSTSIYGFYLSLKKREKLLNLISWNPISISDIQKMNMKHSIPKAQQQQQQLQQNKSADDSINHHGNNNDLKFEDHRQYSAEEIIREYERWQKEQILLQKQKELEERQKYEKKHMDKLKKAVFGEKKLKELENKLGSKKEDRIAQLAVPKDKWQRGKILMQLKKKFPHDIVLQKLIKEEFKENKVFKYPEEYDLFDDEEEYKCKFRGKTGGLEVKEIGAGKELLEKFKVLDGKDLYYLKQEINAQRKKEHQFEKFILDKVNEYLEMKKSRLSGQEETLRQFVSKVYHRAAEEFRDLISKRFPFHAYGQDKKSDTYKKSYPSSFKKYFFGLVKSFVKSKRGQYKRVKNAPPTFLLAGGRKCHIHEFGCPEGCSYVTLNKRVVLRTAMMKKKEREPQPYRSRVWRRRDFKDALNKVFLLGSESEHCTFEPECGSMNKNLDMVIRANPNLNRDGFFDEPDPEAFFNKLGKNFEKSHPEVYKAGVVKRAKLKYMQGKYEEAMNALCEGFNIESLKKRYDPKYMQRFFAEQLLKAKRERLAKEKEEAEKRGVVNFRQRLQKDAPENQKKKPEEDFENKKLLPVFREAFDLIEAIEKRKKDAEKKIRKIQREQNKSKKLMRSFSTFKKSQTRLDMTKNETILFKSIMCPMRDKCLKDMRPRWPTSNTKSITQFGEECPFAHHPMELRFPEEIVTKLASSYQTIKQISQRIDEEKPRQVFKPAGGLYDCVGCSQKSGKHIGGPCNLCRYKEAAEEESKKYTDKTRKTSLMRSMERREVREVKEDKKEMTAIMKALDLDNMYTKKFGLLKKACVLYFYGRFNDAFDEIAKAVKIIQEQKEIEAKKQQLLEKRWRFKLGLDEGFELPIPIEQIDPNKVDEKFLRKMELNGVIQLSTLKLFIEQTHPSKSEEYSKHAYLNKCIEDYYLQFEGAIEDKQQTIKKMKKQVELLDEEVADIEAGLYSSPGASPDKGGNIDDMDEETIRRKPKKLKLCPTLLEKKHCPQAKIPKCQHAHSEYELERMAPGSRMCEYEAKRLEYFKNYKQHEKDGIKCPKKCPNVKLKLCPYAHNPIELDLIPAETKMKNLNGVILSQSSKLRNMKPIEPWKPAKSGDIEHTHLMDMSSKRRRRHGQGSDDEDDEDLDNTKRKEKKKKSIFERENVFRKPYESTE